MKTEYEHLIGAEEMLFDPAADLDGCPGLAVVLQESMNNIPMMDEANAFTWSLQDHVQMTGAAFFDLTTSPPTTARRGLAASSSTRTRRSMMAARQSRMNRKTSPTSSSRTRTRRPIRFRFSNFDQTYKIF